MMMMIALLKSDTPSVLMMVHSNSRPSYLTDGDDGDYDDDDSSSKE